MREDDSQRQRGDYRDKEGEQRGGRGSFFSQNQDQVPKYISKIVASVIAMSIPMLTLKIKFQDKPALQFQRDTGSVWCCDEPYGSLRQMANPVYSDYSFFEKFGVLFIMDFFFFLHGLFLKYFIGKGFILVTKLLVPLKVLLVAHASLLFP